MSPTPAERFDIPNRFPNRRGGRPALRRGIHLGRDLGQERREPGSGVGQLVVDRELTWRPALSGIGYGLLRIEPRPNSQSLGSGREHRTYLYNAGGSPAIGARFVYRRKASGWLLSTPVDVPGQGSETEVIRGQPIDENVARTLLGAIGASEELAGAIFCRDFLDRRWCFPIPDFDHSAILEAIVWRKGSHTPGWALSPGLWVRNPLDAGPFHRPWTGMQPTEGLLATAPVRCPLDPGDDGDTGLFSRPMLSDVAPSQAIGCIGTTHLRRTRSPCPHLTAARHTSVLVSMLCAGLNVAPYDPGGATHT